MSTAACDHATIDFLRIVEVVKPDLLIMVEAYFDESGTHDESNAICVAGYLFETEQAIRLDQEWAEVLSCFGLTHFHAHHCARRI